MQSLDVDKEEKLATVMSNFEDADDVRLKGDRA